MSLLDGSAVSLCALLSSVLLILLTMPYLFLSKKWDANGKHVLITGGSQGLGLAVAQELARKGDAASITIVARDEGKLRKAAEAIEQALPAASTSSKTASKCNYISADLSTFAGASKAFEQHAATHGAPPDTVFCCAGGAKPGYFLDQDEADFQLGMKTDYWTALATAHAAGRSMRDAGLEGGRLILVSSMVGFCGLVGYSQYAPMKHAIRGLAEVLRSEFQLYGIAVQCYFPAGILSPGFEQEEKTKPACLREIEKSDKPQSPQACAKALIRGVERGQFFITSDFQTDLFRAANSGVQPGNGWLLDRLKASLASIALPIWRSFEADAIVKKHRQSVQQGSKGSSSTS